MSASFWALTLSLRNVAEITVPTSSRSGKKTSNSSMPASINFWTTVVGSSLLASMRTTGVQKLMEAGIDEFEVFFPERDEVGTVISATLRKDSVKAQNEALIEIYRKLRPGDPPTLDTATQLFQGMFFDPRKYDFSRVGRMKFNIKLHDKAEATPLDKRTLDPGDFRATIKYLLKLRKG